MQTTIIVILIIFLGVWLCAYLCLWHSIDSIKDNLDYIKSSCNNAYEIRNTEHVLHNLIAESHKDLLAEIACLATKNNEDIKRMGGKFEKWDLIKLDEKDLLITGIEADGDGNVKVHCINNKGMPYTYYRDAPAFKNYARFIKHTASPFDEQEVL